MPWSTPTLRQTREMVRNDITMALRGATAYGNKALRIMSDTMAGLAALVLKYIDWLALQLMPDTAETEWLDRHGQIWLVNADGSKGRKMATLAQGTVTATGTEGVIVPKAITLTGYGENYESLEEFTIGPGPTEFTLRALTPGVAGNQLPGATLTFSGQPPGVDGATTVVFVGGGTDTETDDELRARILDRIQKPPMGGDADDYVQWAERYPAVTRAWCAPQEMGPGTCTVRFMEDALRADQGGFPTPEDVAMVAAYLDTVRPVTVKDLFVEAPIPEPIDYTLELVDDSMSLRAETEASVADMLQKNGAPARSEAGVLIPAQTIYSAWVSEAISRVTREFTLTMDDHPMPNNGCLAVLGTVTYITPPPTTKATGLPEPGKDAVTVLKSSPLGTTRYRKP